LTLEYAYYMHAHHENLGKGALEAAAISRQLHPRFVLVVAEKKTLTFDHIHTGRYPSLRVL